MKALILDAERRTANVKSVPDPRPSSNELLLRVEAVALNPVDSLTCSILSLQRNAL